MSKNTAWSWRHAILQSDLPATTRHVLLTISCFMNEAGDGCYPTTKQLADASGLSERAVCTHLQVAVAAGWLAVSQHGFKGQRWKNNQYEARWPEGTERGSVAQKKALNEVPEGTEPDDKKALNEVQSTSPALFPEKETLSETDVPDARAKRKAYPEAFESAWSAYPTDPNMSKKEAFNAWSKLDEADRASVVKAIPGFVAYCRSHRDYRPIHMCRFISFRRFDGFLTASYQAATGGIDWLDWCQAFFESGVWKDTLGPRPGEPGCRAPPEIIAQSRERSAA